MTPNEVMKNLDQLIPGSKYFKWGEALWLDKVQAYALPTQVQITNICNTARALDKVREHYAGSILIHSWLRPPKYNEIIGGAKASAHLEGLAVDFHINGVDIGRVQEELRLNKSLWPYRGEIGVSWIHLDLRPGPWFRP